MSFLGCLSPRFRQSLGLLGLGFCFLALSSPAQSQPTVPTEGRLVFHSYTAWGIDLSDPNGPNSLDGKIHVYDFATDTLSSIGVIDRFVRHAQNPNLSPDGSKITFAGIPRGPSYSANWFNALDTYEYDFTKGKLTNLSVAARLAPSIDEDAVYGPNGDTVIYKKDFQNLWSLDLATLQETQLFSSALESAEPQVSPDGQWLTYWNLVNGDASTGDVYRRPFLPNGSVGAAILVAATPGVLDYFPSYVDNQTIVHTRWTGPGQTDDEIYLFDTASNQTWPAAFNQTGGSDESDAFRLNDPSSLGFSSTRSGGKGGYDLYVGDPNTGDVHYLQVASTPKEDLGARFQTEAILVQPGQMLFEESFDTVAINSTSFDSQYGGPQFSTDLNNTNVSVAGGVLRLATSSGFGEANVTTNSWFEPNAGIVITADIGADASGGDFNVGITLGDTSLVFHPGFTGTPGAFRVGGGPNQDMGFVPANGILHSWKIEVSETGEVTVAITDGTNSANVFTHSYTDATLADGFSIGLYREGGPGSAPFYGLYDNLLVETAAPELTGDYNNDGVVDPADYTVWRDSLGSTTNLAADGDGNGAVEQADYDLWKNNFGASLATQGQTIPEPNTTLLVVLAGIVLFWRISILRGNRLTT